MVRTRSQIKTIVNQYVDNLHARGIQVEQIVLFGFYARQRAREGSDIDLAVIAPQFARLNLRERYETLGLANMTLREPIQAIGFSPRQWRDAERGSFAEEIRRTGRVIYRRAKRNSIVRRKIRTVQASGRVT
ncbi:MAG: nucleotidyltransferase domain-containing protein [Chloroflexi bacterium]|nr:nucleotidyltransferase domain-containing protein [Chloroflexota bacterium]